MGEGSKRAGGGEGTHGLCYSKIKVARQVGGCTLEWSVFILFSILHDGEVGKVANILENYCARILGLNSSI